MAPLYAAGVSDLGPGDFIQVECPCGHTELLTAAMLATAGVALDRKVIDLAGRMRCRECDERGKAVVSIKWAASTNVVAIQGRLDMATMRRPPRLLL
jgi:hypothetical protein